MKFDFDKQVRQASVGNITYLVFRPTERIIGEIVLAAGDHTVFLHNGAHRELYEEGSYFTFEAALNRAQFLLETRYGEWDPMVVFA